MKKRVLLVCLCIVFLFSFSGCGYEEEDKEKVSDLDFTVLKEEEIPEELAQVIAEKKTVPFHLTFEDDALYIAVGYGEQNSGGYSIEVQELYLGKNVICFHTQLIGPKKSEKVEEVSSYPYLVVKTEYRDEKVVFED